MNILDISIFNIFVFWMKTENTGVHRMFEYYRMLNILSMTTRYFNKQFSYKFVMGDRVSAMTYYVSGRILTSEVVCCIRESTFKSLFYHVAGEAEDNCINDFKLLESYKIHVRNDENMCLALSSIYDARAYKYIEGYWFGADRFKLDMVMKMLDLDDVFYRVYSCLDVVGGYYSTFGHTKFVDYETVVYLKALRVMIAAYFNDRKGMGGSLFGLLLAGYYEYKSKWDKLVRILNTNTGDFVDVRIPSIFVSNIGYHLVLLIKGLASINLSCNELVKRFRQAKHILGANSFIKSINNQYAEMNRIFDVSENIFHNLFQDLSLFTFIRPETIMAFEFELFSNIRRDYTFMVARSQRGDIFKYNQSIGLGGTPYRSWLIDDDVCRSKRGGKRYTNKTFNLKFKWKEYY